MKYSKSNPIPSDAPRTIQRECKHHGLTDYRLYTRSRKRKDGQRSMGYRCVRCNADNKAKHRRNIREVLIGEAGGKCQMCGYDRCLDALHFHHRDPESKEFELSKLSTNLEQARLEAEKCDLLCANCHAEAHARGRSIVA